MSDADVVADCDDHIQPMRDEDFLLVDSQTLAIVDLTRVDDIVEEARPFFTGERFLEGGFHGLDYGAVCHTWMDGNYGYVAHVKDGAIHAFEMSFADEEDEFETTRWYRAGTFESPSGVLVIGDSGQLRDYVEDPFTRPFESFELWALAQLPGPGAVAVKVRVGENEPDDPVNIGMRWEWVGTSA